MLAITLNLQEGFGQKDDLALISSPTQARGTRLLVTFRDLTEAWRMGEIAEFVEHGASKITPKMLQDVYRKLPMLRLKFAEIDDAKHPHLPEQLEFLSAVVEDFAEGVANDIPYHTIASAVFALLYAHRQVDLIPDSIPEFGHSDDSAVVRAVLIQNEKVLAEFAEKQGLVWEDITVNP